MSAWIVHKRHIDAMIETALCIGIHSPIRSYGPFRYFHNGASHVVDYTTADKVGAMLWAENYRSVNYRYSESDPAPEYKFEHWRGRCAGLMPLGAAYNMIACYEYQSCEHPDWEKSEAASFCLSLLKALGKFAPGYDAAPWGIDDSTPIDCRKVEVC